MELYHRTIDGAVECLNAKEAKVAMGEVHKGMCGTRQSVHTM
jgi:hypothetical protein